MIIGYPVPAKLLAKEGWMVGVARYRDWVGIALPNGRRLPVTLEQYRAQVDEPRYEDLPEIETVTKFMELLDG